MKSLARRARRLRWSRAVVGLALLAGSTAWADAPQEEVAACRHNAACGRDRYCWKRPGACDGPGRCRPRPDACTQQYDPVCGCDGRTHPNACAAARVGVSVRHAGRCRDADERCRSNDDCAADRFCRKAVGDCGGEGRCVDRPEACPRIYDPVCGCNGRTYGNACGAARAGVSVRRPGRCRAAPSPPGE